MLVIDASIIGPLALADERPLADDVVARVQAERLVAPAHWPLEVANLLLMAERRDRLSRERRLIALREFQGWSVSLDGDIAFTAWRDVSELAEHHGLTVYDAAYLELARRRGAGIATRDRALLHAARTSGVDIVSDLS